MHQTLAHTINPRNGSYEKIYRHDFQLLYAIWGQHSVNWAKIILYEFQTFNQGRMKTIHYGSYIMRISRHFKIVFPDSDYPTVGSLNIKTLSLMGLPKQYQSHTIITFEHWLENQTSDQPQPPSRQQAPKVEATTSSQQQPRWEFSKIQEIGPQA